MIETSTALRLSAQRALLGTITPNIRRVFVGLEDTTIQFIVIFDGEISEDDK